MEGEKRCEPEPPVKRGVQCVGGGSVLAADVPRQRWPGFCDQNWVQQGTLTCKLGTTILIENSRSPIVFGGSD